MKYDFIAAAFHIFLVIIVYVLYGLYPPSQIPIPYFEMLTYGAGFGYGVTGVLTLREYVRTLAQAKFNMAVLLIVVGGLLFISESVGNAG